MLLLQNCKGLFWQLTRHLAIALIRSYQAVGSIFLGGSCRFEPSCSAYACGCYSVHHPSKATVLVLRRLSKCRPGGGFGYDPVPLKSVTENLQRVEA